MFLARVFISLIEVCLQRNLLFDFGQLRRPANQVSYRSSCLAAYAHSSCAMRSATPSWSQRSLIYEIGNRVVDDLDNAVRIGRAGVQVLPAHGRLARQFTVVEFFS